MKLAHKLTYDEVLNQIPYIVQLQMSAVIPVYDGGKAGGTSGQGPSEEKSMSMFDMVANLQKGLGV